jgi:hypothetical protein
VAERRDAHALTRLAKIQRVDSLKRRVEDQLSESTTSSRLKIFSYPLDDAVLDFQWEAFLRERACYPEDYAAFHLVVKLFAEKLGTTDPDRADYFFLPLYWPAFECHRIELTETMESLQFIRRKARHLIFSPWDTYPRPLERRANPYCCVDYGQRDGIVRDGYYVDSLRWLDERFTLMCYESSIDMLPYDIGIYPTLPLTPTSPFGARRDLLYSFAGSFLYFDDDHVRGRESAPYWETLRRETRRDAFVGTLDEARSRFKRDLDYLSLPRASTFTLCPAGWGRWSFRMTEAILSGSIPIILADYYELPFRATVPWSEFSLVLPESGLKRIDRIVRSISPEKVLWLQRGLEAHQRLFTSGGVIGPLVGKLEATLKARPWRRSRPPHGGGRRPAPRAPADRSRRAATR